MIGTWGTRTYVMGILNVTPDSFSGDGVFAGHKHIDRALKQAEKFVLDGADIIDIGGESTRPGSIPISADEEIFRVVPVIEAIKKNIDVIVSVDTYRSEVAKYALEVGADWINDVWGLKMDTTLAELAARRKCPIILMHNRSKPKNVSQEDKLGGRYVGVQYENLVDNVKLEIQESVAIALTSGVERSQIIVDPGIGFGKTVQQNLQLIDELGKIKELGYPVLLGPSRKSFIGYTLDLPVDERIEGTAATVALGIDRGADIIRVHDVKAMVRIARMTDAIVRKKVEA